MADIDMSEHSEDLYCEPCSDAGIENLATKVSDEIFMCPDCYANLEFEYTQVGNLMDTSESNTPDSEAK